MYTAITGRVSNAVVHVTPVGSAGLGDAHYATSTSSNNSHLNQSLQLEYMSLRDHNRIASDVTDFVLALPITTETVETVIAQTDQESSKVIMAISEVQVYYQDDGRVMVKVDVVMNPDLTIRTAHSVAG